MAQRAGWGVGAWVRSVRRYVGYLIAGLSLAAPESMMGITQRRDGTEGGLGCWRVDAVGAPYERRLA
jgi:hypothetical protein